MLLPGSGRARGARHPSLGVAADALIPGAPIDRRLDLSDCLSTPTLAAVSTTPCTSPAVDPTPIWARMPKDR